MGAPSARSAAGERGLPGVAGGGEDAFGRLVGPHRSELYAHCYRMLGGLHDAEDALQDTLLRAWRGLPGFDDRRPPRPWLYRIATNACLDAIARRPGRMLPAGYGPPACQGDDQGEPQAELPWIEPCPDEQLGLQDGYASPEARYEQREAVELAFITALQHLSGRQRAVLILREVLGFSAKEVAQALDSSPASVNSALQRARKAIEDRIPGHSQQATLRLLGDKRVRDLAERFADAFETADVDAIVAMLAEHATFAMPPYASWYRGRDAIADSWLMPCGPALQLRYVPVRANGQLAFGAYRLDPEDGAYLPVALDVITLDGPRITDITAFRTPRIFPYFGLPEELHPQASPAQIRATFAAALLDS
jgi:RNA polymerase sigma-70 factor (ECF subfamily)